MASLILSLASPTSLISKAQSSMSVLLLFSSYGCVSTLEMMIGFLEIVSLTHHLRNFDEIF
jgi:hypothetical protein